MEDIKGQVQKWLAETPGLAEALKSESENFVFIRRSATKEGLPTLTVERFYGTDARVVDKNIPWFHGTDWGKWYWAIDSQGYTEEEARAALRHDATAAGFFVLA